MPPYKFEVEIRDFQPLSGKAKRVANKKDLAGRIGLQARDEIETAQKELRSIKVGLRVRFYLWRGDKKAPNTTSKKDLDNLLKLVFDALQPFVDSQRTTEGIGIIETDDNIFHVEATKEIVEEKDDAGLRLEILPLGS